MKSYLILFVISLVLTLLLTPLVRRWAIKWGAMDCPDGQRRIHKHPTARLGGVAIYLAVLLTLGCVPLLGNLVSQGLRASWTSVSILLGTATLILLLGIYDDFRGSTATTKLVVQVAAAIVLYCFDYRIGHISLPMGDMWILPVWLSLPVTILWVVGLTNAFNLIDGIDGLAAGASGFALLSLFICSLAQGHPEVTLLTIITVGAVMGFLRFNFNPATIFLGDSGSLLLGFLAAALSLAGAQKGPTLIAISIPLVSFGLPLAEVGLSIARRVAAGAPVFQSDRRHIHHMLLNRGMTQRQAVILLYGVCALFALFGLMLLNPERNRTALIFFVLGAGIIIGVQRLRYSEFHVLGARVRAGVLRRRRTFSLNAHVSNMSAKLRVAQTIEQFLAVFTELCAAQDFNKVVLEFFNSSNSTALSLKNMPEGVPWDWTWRRNQEEEVAEAVPPHCWIMRAPLTDQQGAVFGSVTFYSDVDNDQLGSNFALLCDTLRLDISNSLSTINRTPRWQHSQELRRVAASF